MRVSRYWNIVAVLAVSVQVTTGAALARPGAIVRLPSIQVLSMITSTTGWALDTSAILRTSDGGTRWVNVSPPSIIISRSSMLYAADRRRAWVTAAPTGSRAPILARTVDGGHSWRLLPIPVPSDAVGVARLVFVDARHGWLLASLGASAGSEGVQVLRTTDGGTTWATVSRTDSAQPGPGGLPLSGIKTGISFRDSVTGWVTAAGAGPDNVSRLYETIDGGRTWLRQRLSFPPSFRQVVPVLYPPRFFTALGGLLPVILTMQDTHSAIDFYATHDGGATWSSTAALPYIAAKASPRWDFVDRNHGWVAVGASLYSTSDGGYTWNSSVADLGVHDVAQLDFVNSNDGWAVGAAPTGRCAGLCLTRDGPLAGVPLFRTTNGGRTWTRLAPYVTYPPDGGTHIGGAG